jgi:8-oxo-dGTP pyrophosphatase MutT (NUDIX family)
METKRKISALAPYKIEKGLAYIFLQKRAKDAKREPGLFGFFGEGAERKETPKETLIREIKEELDFTSDNFIHFKKYGLPKTLMDLFIVKVDNNFEKRIKILEGECGRWFSEKDFLREKKIIIGDLRILEELYQKIPKL